MLELFSTLPEPEENPSSCKKDLYRSYVAGLANTPLVLDTLIAQHSDLWPDAPDFLRVAARNVAVWRVNQERANFLGILQDLPIERARDVAKRHIENYLDFLNGNVGGGYEMAQKAIVSRYWLDTNGFNDLKKLYPIES
jgi:hypothetical protein